MHTILSDLILGQTIGEGAFGIVRLCKLKTTNKLYALKKLNDIYVKKMKNY